MSDIPNCCKYCGESSFSGGDAFRLFGCGTKRWHLSGDWLSGRKCHFNLVAERDALRAEVERLRDSVLDYQTRCNPYVSLATQRDADQLRAEVERLMAENTLLLGQRERAMQAARWLRSYRPSSKQFKAASAELDALEKEVQS